MSLLRVTGYCNPKAIPSCQGVRDLATDIERRSVAKKYSRPRGVRKGRKDLERMYLVSYVSLQVYEMCQSEICLHSSSFRQMPLRQPISCQTRRRADIFFIQSPDHLREGGHPSPLFSDLRAGPIPLHQQSSSSADC